MPDWVNVKSAPYNAAGDDNNNDALDVRARDETSSTEINKLIRVTSDPPTFAAQSATPSVSEGSAFKTANTSATTITNFLDGFAGQEITIIFGGALTTVQSNSNIQLTTSLTSTPNDTLKLILDGSVWRELSRSVLS